LSRFGSIGSILTFAIAEVNIAHVFEHRDLIGVITRLYSRQPASTHL
jgi:hypothetical protein